MPSPLQRADCQLFLLAFMVGWQAALVYRLTVTIADARREARMLRAERDDARGELHARDLTEAVAAAAAAGNGAGPAATFVAPEHGPAEPTGER